MADTQIALDAHTLQTLSSGDPDALRVLAHMLQKTLEAQMDDHPPSSALRELQYAHREPKWPLRAQAHHTRRPTPPPASHATGRAPSRPLSSTATRVPKLKHFNCLWTFLEHEGVKPTIPLHGYSDKIRGGGAEVFDVEGGKLLDACVFEPGLRQVNRSSSTSRVSYAECELQQHADLKTRRTLARALPESCSCRAHRFRCFPSIGADPRPSPRTCGAQRTRARCPRQCS